MATNLPSMHGRTHIPSGYAMVVKSSASSTLLTTGGSDPLPATVLPAASAGTSVEWIEWQSTTDLAGAGVTTMAFSLLNSNYDNVTPTFDLSGTSPRICRGGIYMHYITVINISSTAGVETHFRAVVTRTAGQTPSFINYNPDIQLVDSVGPAATQLSTPWWQGLILYAGSSGAFGTPTTLRVQADKLDDGVSVADTSPFMTLTVVRLGDAYA